MKNENIIIFDGVCNFCNTSVNFIIKRDPTESFHFSTSQSNYAQTLMKQHGINTHNVDTIILIKKGKCFFKSDAILEIAKDLSGFWYFLRVFIIVPKNIRNFIYDFISNNRYKLYGKNASCIKPNDKLKKRFYE